MGFREWFRRDRLRKGTRRRRARRRRRASSRVSRFAGLTEEVASMRQHLARHDVQLAELVVRTSDERLEQTVTAAIQRLQPSAALLGLRPFAPIVHGERAQATAMVATASAPANHLPITAAQRLVLNVLAADGGDRYLSYADIGRLLGKSPTAVKHLVNQIKMRGVRLESVVSTNNQARYRLRTAANGPAVAAR